MRLIDASAACDVIGKIRPRHIVRHSKWVQEETLSIGSIYNALLTKVPPVDAEPVVHGHWIDAYPDIEPNPMFMYGICSECGFEQGLSNKLHYCPNCGAKMDEVSE